MGTYLVQGSSAEADTNASPLWRVKSPDLKSLVMPMAAGIPYSKKQRPFVFLGKVKGKSGCAKPRDVGLKRKACGLDNSWSGDKGRQTRFTEVFLLRGTHR